VPGASVPMPRTTGDRIVVAGLPRSGEVVRLGRAASVQFAGRPILFRVIRLHDWSTYDGWAWLDGYELNNSGEAVERRSVFVQVNGIERAHVTPPYVRQAPREAANRATSNGGTHHSRGKGPHGNDPA
jgi:hypothetical protein